MKQTRKIPRRAALLALLLITSCTTYELTAHTAQKEFIPGTSTTLYTYNGTMPGPTLQATLNKPISVHIQNDLPEPITMHWHGVRVPNDMDGVPDITQQPIMPGEDYTYTFTPRDPGTYWYHSHVEAHKQVEMGLQGAFIVEDPEARVMSDDEHILVLDDIALDDQGNHRSFDLNYMHGRFGNIFLINGAQNPTIHSQGNTHRLRLINTANARSFNLYFDGATATILGTDIGYTIPYNDTTIVIHPGERYDIVINANESFRITHLARTPVTLATIDVTPRLHDTLPTKNTYQAITVEEQHYTRTPDLTLTLEGVRDPVHGLVWQIGGTDTLTNPGNFTLRTSKTKIRLHNLQGQPHPMHLHGQRFIILTRNNVREDTPTWKDTVMVGSNEVVDILVESNNPGDWVFHCHILEHARAGMLTTIHIDD